MRSICDRTLSTSRHYPLQIRLGYQLYRLLMVATSLPCPVELCQQSFKRLFNLKRHLETMHGTGEGRCVCEQCGKSQKITNSLARHRSRCTGQNADDNPAIFHCPFCERRFSNFGFTEGDFIKVGIRILFYINQTNGRCTKLLFDEQSHPEFPLPEERRQFTKWDEFKSWMESLPNVQYVNLSGSSSTKSGKRYKTFVCRRSCETMTYELKQYSFGDSENEDSRPSRGKMSCKLEEACTYFSYCRDM